MFSLNECMFKAIFAHECIASRIHENQFVKFPILLATFSKESDEYRLSVACLSPASLRVVGTSRRSRKIDRPRPAADSPMERPNASICYLIVEIGTTAKMK